MAPDAVWALVADVARMGEWSPETAGCEWLGGAKVPAVGARFRGRNRRGWRRWSTSCVVTECEPGKAFAFDVSAGPLAVATWAYRLEPAEGGCIVRETFTDRRTPPFKLIGGLASGVWERREHNRRGMETTLERLAAVAEGSDHT